MLQSEAVTVTHWRIACLLTQFWDACSSYRRMWVLLFSLSSLLCHSRPVATGVVAVCAGGKCIAPDTCQCVVWWSKLRDGQGIPRFQTPAGDPQNSGWTGYDCNTPICVQAERWVPNTVPETLELVASVNDGTSFQAGCVNETRYTPANRTRTSDSNLCGVVNWWQGVYLDSWSNGLTVRPLSISAPGRYIKSNFDNYIRPSQKNYSRVAGPLVTGEGIFACYNLGSCVAPDTCECPDGWAGYDCASPLCRHTNVFGDVVGCLNLGTCGFRTRARASVATARG